LSFLLILVSNEYDDVNSMDDFLRELDKEKTNIIISKDIRKYKKSTTVVSGLPDKKNAEYLTRDLKTKIGTGGTFKDGQIILQGDHRETVRDMLIARGFNKETIEVL
jgi:translation initiation factor 1